MSSERISVRVSPGIARRLKERANATGAQESEMVREALEEYLSKNGGNQTAYDLAKKAGLIGCAPGLPKDLSTNKRYFKGFGKSK